MLAQFKPLCDTFTVALEPPVSLERVLIVSKQRIYERRVAWFQAIVNPLAVFACGDKCRLTDNLQVRGKIGLGHLHRI